MRVQEVLPEVSKREAAARRSTGASKRKSTMRHLTKPKALNSHLLLSKKTPLGRMNQGFRSSEVREGVSISKLLGMAPITLVTDLDHHLSRILNMAEAAGVVEARRCTLFRIQTGTFIKPSDRA